MTTRRRMDDRRLAFYENSIACQVRIVRRTQQLAGLLDVSTLEEVEPLIADIIAAAGSTRRELIRVRDEDKDEAG